MVGMLGFALAQPNFLLPSGSGPKGKRPAAALPTFTPWAVRERIVWKAIHFTGA